MTAVPPSDPARTGHPVTYLQEECITAIGDTWSNDTLPAAWQLDGPLDVDAVHAAVAALVDRHEGLRTAFDLAPPVRQRVAATVPANISTVTAPADSAGPDLRAVILDQIAAPFDLTRAPLWRMCLIRLDPHRSILLMVAHHLIVDGTSYGLLQHDLAALYRAVVNRQPVRLPPVTVQPRHIAAQERRPRQLPQRHVDYWRSALLPQPGPLTLPRPTAAGPLTLLNQPVPDVTAEELAALRRVAEAHGAGVPAALRAVVVASLARYATDGHVTMGLVYANRDQPGLETVVAWLSDHTWLRIQVGDRPPLGELIRRVEEQTRAARRHHLPTGLVEQITGPIVADVSVNVMPMQPPPTYQAGPLSITPHPIPTTGITPTIGKPFSGGLALGYQLRYQPRGRVQGELWGHHTLGAAAIDRLAHRVSAYAAALAATAEEQVGGALRAARP